MCKSIKKKLSMDLNRLAECLYAGRDKSHGIKHVKKVRDTAMIISKRLNIHDPMTLIKIETAALFHDLWDHKYIDKNTEQYAIKKNKLSCGLKCRFFSEHDIKDIEIIIDNISLTREMNLRKKNQTLNLKHLQLIRDIVSDADKLEMLGSKGIVRIIDYQMYKFPKTKSYELKKIVKTVYNEKISKLLSENYIKTEPGKEMAIPLMREIDNYIKMIN